MADCLAHSRCSKLAINFLLRIIYYLWLCSPNSTGSLGISTSLFYWSWTIHLLDLLARSLINLYFLCSEPKGRSQPVHAFPSDPGKQYRGKCIILESDKPKVIPQPHYLLSVWPWLSYLNSLSLILIIGRREKFCQHMRVLWLLNEIRCVKHLVQCLVYVAIQDMSCTPPPLSPFPPPTTPLTPAFLAIHIWPELLQFCLETTL